MSEEVLTESDTENEDFSASEDEWLPTKVSKKKSIKKSLEENNSDEDDVDSDSETGTDLEEFEKSVKKKGKQTTSRKRSVSKSSPKQASQSGNKRKRLTPGLRDRLYQQYKLDLLKEVTPVRAPSNSSVSDILEKCQYQRKTAIGSQRTMDGSESSGDDHLVDPDKLDLRSTFFNEHEAPPSNSGPPQFDVNAEMRLSDSSGEDREERIKNGEKYLPPSIPKQAAYKLISHINQQSGEFMNFHNLDQFTAKVEEAKEFLKSYQQKEALHYNTGNEGDETTPSCKKQEENVSNLLAMGEIDAAVTLRKAQSNTSSESEWEDVQTGESRDGKIVKELNQSDDANWQVTIEMDTAQSKRKRREELEMELYIKRQINKVKRANQLNYHKSCILGAIAIGQQLNRIISGGRIRGLLISIMQEKTNTRKGKWDEKKVQRLADWFKKEFNLQSNNFLGARTGYSLGFRLSLALYTRKVVCRRDYILLFLACLRLAGVQTRTVLSANVPSKRPALNDLCPMSERRMKDNFDKTLSNRVQEEQSKLEIELPKNLQSKTKEKSSIKAFGNVETKEEKPSTITPPKENPPKKLLKNTTQKTVTRRTTRKALATLKIPQLDGGDDYQLPSTMLPLRRSLRSKSASTIPLESPGSSPFTKRKSNTPAALKVTTKTLSNATRKRKLFREQEKPENVAPKTTNTRSQGKQEADQKPVKTKTAARDTKEQRGKLKETRPNTQSDDDTFELKRCTARKNHKTEISTIACEEITNNGRIPIVVLSNIMIKSIDRKVLSTSSSSEDEVDEKTETERIKPKPKKNSAPATASQSIKGRKKKSKCTSGDSEDDSDFELPKEFSNLKKKKSTAHSKKSPSVRRGNAGDRQTVNDKTDLWIEFYCENTKRWISFDLASGRADCVDYIVRNATSPISYVFAWDNESLLKDVTARYVQNWNTVCRMLRVEQTWLDKSLSAFVGTKTERDLLEDKELNKLDADKPLPKTIGELKNHPLYALRRHLLKFEALYPAEPLTLGFVRGEAIYPRECVHTLQTREKWYKQGRVVRPFETAYKVVKCWKYDRPNNTWLKDQPCDIFGHWQTEEYDPPAAENGLVPRNEYGNVELFIEKMLPKGTVHLKLPGLNKTCKRLQIDCAPALTGFDMAKMRVVPVYDGFVVCQEFAEQAVEEWYKEMEQEELREQEKMEKRVYGNWKRLIKGVLVRRKLQNKYNFDNLS